MKETRQKISGADIFFECLRKEKVEYIFGYPGGAVLKLYEKLYDVDFLQHILTATNKAQLTLPKDMQKQPEKLG